jgi:hypothetical protein
MAHINQPRSACLPPFVLHCIWRRTAYKRMQKMEFSAVSAVHGAVAACLAYHHLPPVPHAAAFIRTIYPQ